MYESKNNNSHGEESNILGPSIMMKLMRRKSTQKILMYSQNDFEGECLTQTNKIKFENIKKTIESPMP